MISFSNTLSGQLDTLSKNKYLAFPNWKIGDAKYINASSTEIEIENGDSTTSVSNSHNLLTVLDKNNKFYVLGLKQLDLNSLEFKYLKDHDVNLNSDFDYLNKFTNRVISRTIDHIIKNVSSINGVQFKIDNWGYYQGLEEVIDFDTLKYILDTELKKTKELSFLAKDELDEFSDVFSAQEILQIISVSFYDNIRIFLEPYDLALSKEAIIDTMFYNIPWFLNPIECERRVVLLSKDSDIQLEIFYKYLIDEKDYVEDNNLNGLDFFSLELHSTYVLDYESKWIEKINSETIKVENNKMFIDKTEVIIQDMR